MKEPGEFPHFGNVAPFQNRISSAAAEERFLVSRISRFTIDRLYGHAWNYGLDAGDAVYGRTDDFPEGPLDLLAKGAFIRVPYRRVPRIRIGSMQELRSFANAIRLRDTSISVMWRGQSELHSLRTRRSAEDLLRFYGTTDVIEPSLLPSAARGGIEIERYMDAWFGLLDIFIDEIHVRMQGGAAVTDELERDSAAMRQSCGFRAWAFGVAQHYGLPSTGLDLSSDLDVAVFFALHKFMVKTGGQTTIERVQPDAQPVILLMSIFEGDLGVDKTTAPAHLITPRSFAQKAHFFRTAWGAAPNRAAERIVAILDLVDHAQWTLALSDKMLFPTIEADPFSEFLHEARSRFPEITDTVPLQNVYFTT